MIILFKKILFLLGEKRRHLPWMLILFLIASLTELIGLGLIAPYMLLILNPESLSDGNIGLLMRQVFLMLTMNELIVVMSIILISIFILKTIIGIIVNRAIIVFSLNIQAQLQSSLMTLYQGLSYAEYSQRNSSEYITAIQTYTSSYANGMLGSLLKVVSESIAVIAIIILLAYTNGPALMLLAAMLGTLGFGYDRFFRRKITSYGREINSHQVRMVQATYEGIEGFKEVRILGKEAYFHNIVHNSAERVTYYTGKSALIGFVPRFLLELILVMFIITLVLSAVLNGYNLQTLVPTLSLFGFAAIRLIPSVNVLINGLSRMRFSQDGTSRLYKDLSKRDVDTQSQIKEINTVFTAEEFQTLKLNEVCFHYPNTLQNALNKVTLTIRKGESIGLIGTSGSGKTTLLDCMLGLLEPQSGSIEFNGEPLEQSKDHWRKNVAYLPQEVFLIDNTLRCNVALGVSEDDIDDEQLNKALKQARLTDLVNQLSDGVETILGERGILLSGGQRQRIALARAFYHDRTVLVLDESTSALDHKTEQEIVEEIKQLKGTKTMIIIAHRLTTVQNCDRIYRLENGEIVAQGSYESVVEK